MPNITWRFVRKFVFNDLRADSSIRFCTNIVEREEPDAPGLAGGCLRTLSSFISSTLTPVLRMTSWRGVPEGLGEGTLLRGAILGEARRASLS